MACNRRFNSSPKNHFLVYFLFYVVCFTYVSGYSRYEYLSDDNEADNLETFRIISLHKRDTENVSAKKASYSEKKPTKLKETEEIPSDKKAKIPDNSTSVVTTELPDLPATVPGNTTFQNDTTFTNNTHHYIYYNATFHEGSSAKDLWIDLTNGTVHQMLSNSHRRAATVPLSFEFPFYGHPVRNITIATGGFLYTGDYMHTWLAATQYIAPLMANFDTSVHNSSLIRYQDTGSSFTVQWENVYLQDIKQGEDKEQDDGPFTFQVTLHQNGDMAFVYQNVSVPVTEIDNDHHPVKVGLSDAYIMEKAVVFLRRKTIYEYHRADLANQTIGNETAIYFTALPTCQRYPDCESCMASKTSFDCVWCDLVGRCSNGLDRNRQEWHNKQCDSLTRSELKCPAPTPEPSPEIIPTKPSSEKKPISTTPASKTSDSSQTTQPASTAKPTIPPSTTVAPTEHPAESVPLKVVTLPPGSGGIVSNPSARRSEEDDHESSHKGSVGAGAVISILIIVCLVTGFGIWIVYAYKFPQSPSGQLLIRYRPSQWRWRHGEARYTAASIHI